MKPGRWLLLVVLAMGLGALDPMVALCVLTAFAGGVLWGGAL